MDGKIALEEHWEPADTDVTGEHIFTEPDYFAEVERRLKEVDERVEDMDRNGIGVTILSLTQPGIEGITNTRTAIDTAKRLNDHAAKELVGRHPDRLRMFASVPLQDPEAAAAEQIGRAHV